MSDNEVGTDDATGGDSWVASVLKQPLSKLQALVGIAAGLISVASLVIPLAGHIGMPTNGEFVGVIQEARSSKPVLDAAVEISTPGDAIITTLFSRDGGRVRFPLKEGQYRVRVSHPHFTPEFRQVQVMAGQSSEVHVALAPKPAPVSVKVVEKPGAVRRFFSKLGF
jgi:hypothetical protein